MKLKSHIARYIRRCGYAVALSLATGSIATAAGENLYPIISSYKLDADGNVVYSSDGKAIEDTSMITAAIRSGEAILRKWCPIRPDKGYNYQFFIWNDTKPVYSYNYVRVDHAIRPTIQDELTKIAMGYEADGSKTGEGIPGFHDLLTFSGPDFPETNEFNGKRVSMLSYIGVRSLAPSEQEYLTYSKGCGDSVEIDNTTTLHHADVKPTDKPVDVSYNKLSITNSGFHLALAAYTQFGEAHHNELYIQDVRSSEDMIGGYSNNGDAHHNKVTVIRSQSIIGQDYASQLGSYTYNSGGKITAALTHTGKDNSSYNNSTFVYGSFVYANVNATDTGGDAYNNDVLVVRSKVSEGMKKSTEGQDCNFAAETTCKNKPHSVYNNSYTIDDTFDKSLVPETLDDGTEAYGRTASEPDVSTFYQEIVGGLNRRGYGKYGSHYNSVTIKGITTTGTLNETKGSSVTTTIYHDVIGGRADNDYGSKSAYADAEECGYMASATGNVVEIVNAAIRSDHPNSNIAKLDVGKVYGGYVNVGSFAKKENHIPGNADNNVVYIENTLLQNSVYGGYNEATTHVEQTGADGTTRMYGDASNNTQIFKNLETEGKSLTFYGGWSEGGNTNYNNVHLRGTENNMANTYLHGGWGKTGHVLDSEEDYLTNTRQNWLHVEGFQDAIQGFDHFEGLHFVVTRDINPEQPMLILTGDQSKTDEATNVLINGNTPITLTVDLTDVADILKPGSIVPLIGHRDSDTGTEIDGVNQVDDEVKQQSARRGVTRKVTYQMQFEEVNDATSPFDNMGVVRIIGDVKHEATPESKALIEGRIATLTLNNMGGNLVAEQGIDNACRGLDDAGNPADANHFIAVDQNAKGAVTYVPKTELRPGNRLFFAMNGAHNKVDSGSDVDVDGTNALVGISRGFMEKNALVLGAFMETGWGKYHTHNNFGAGANVPFVRGSGETSYVGAGALLRYHLRNLGRKPEGVSVDASIRAGRQETDYATADLVDSYGAFAAYEQESDYLAGHVGVNYSFEPKDKLTAMLYARYLWTHVSADKAVVCGETVDFDGMSSNRIRLGGRMSWQASEKWTPYAGAAYEWEFSGTSHAATHGMGITAPSMRGGSVIGEVGVIWQPNIARALWVEGALQGSVGKNENYGAKVGVSIGF